jgi:hypothetical protein
MMKFIGNARVFVVDDSARTVAWLLENGKAGCNCRANGKRGPCAHVQALRIVHEMGLGGPETPGAATRAKSPSKRKPKAVPAAPEPSQPFGGGSADDRIDRAIAEAAAQG